MGQFFTKIILQGVNRESLVNYLNAINRKTFVSPTINNFTIVFDEKSEEQSQEFFRFASELSRQFHCPAFAILIHDDSVFGYELYKIGEIIDDYVSNIGFYKPESGNYPKGGDAQKLCTTLGVKNAINKVRSILREPGDTKGYFFASDRLIKLIKCLGISTFWGSDCVGGYRYIELGDIVPMTRQYPSPEVALSQLIKTGITNKIN